MQLPLVQARNFSVFERGKITLSIGDRVRFTKNVKHRWQKFLNNELRTVTICFFWALTNRWLSRLGIAYGTRTQNQRLEVR